MSRLAVYSLYVWVLLKIQESYTIHSYEHILDSVANGRINYNSQYMFWVSQKKSETHYIRFQIAFWVTYQLFEFHQQTAKATRKQRKTRMNKISYVH